MDLEVWLNKIRQTRSHAEVFAILDEFRTHEWSDDQCSKMARLYMRMLDNFGPLNDDSVDEKASSPGDKKDSKEAKSGKDSKDKKDSKPKESLVAAAAAASFAGAAEGGGEIKPVTTGATPVNDGPVWYEKM
jgi:hypothetical protein